LGGKTKKINGEGRHLQVEVADKIDTYAGAAEKKNSAVTGTASLHSYIPVPLPNSFSAMHFYANPSDVRIFLPRRATAFRKNAVECTDCAGNRRPEIADGEQRLLLHWHCIFRFRVPISWVPSSHPQFPSTSTIASTSTSRSRSRRAPKMCAKKTEKSARKISKEKLNFSCILLGTFYKSISKSIETRNMKYYKKLKEI